MNWVSSFQPPRFGKLSASMNSSAVKPDRGVMHAQKGNSHRIEEIKKDLVWVESSMSAEEQVPISLETIAFPESAGHWRILWGTTGSCGTGFTLNSLSKNGLKFSKR